MTKPKPKDTPAEDQPQETLPKPITAPPLDYRHYPDGSLVVILASGQKASFAAGEIPQEFQKLPKRKGQ